MTSQNTESQTFIPVDQDPSFAVITGSPAGETLTGSAQADVINAGAGNDTVNANGGNDVVHGDDGDDTLNGGAGDDLLFGDAGNDVLTGGAGFDTLTGGTGDDTFVFDGADTIVENAGEGIDTVRTAVNFYTLDANVENLVLTGSADLGAYGNLENNVMTGNIGANGLYGGDGDDTLNGQAGDDMLVGGIGADTLNGGNGADSLEGDDGNDILNGENGNDVLNGNAGADVMAGGAGDDLYIVDNAGDLVTEGLGLGLDGVNTDLVRYTLTDNVENLTGTSALRQTLTGNAGRNTITAGAGNDTLDGMADNDTLIGNAGDDRLTGGAGADQFIFNDNGQGYSTQAGVRQVDTVMDFAPRDGDRIDLRAIDADINTGGDQAFHFVANFTKSAGEAVLKYVASTNTTALQLDMDGDGVADYQIQLKGGDFTTGVNTLTGAESANQGGWIL